MQANEVAKLLTMIASVDDRLDPDEMRIAMWYETLNRHMPYEYAKQFVIEHYAEKRTVMMPADLNEKWKAVSKKIAQEENERKLKLQSTDGVPMPKEIADMMKELFRAR